MTGRAVQAGRWVGTDSSHAPRQNVPLLSAQLGARPRTAKGSQGPYISANCAGQGEENGVAFLAKVVVVRSHSI